MADTLYRASYVRIGTFMQGINAVFYVPAIKKSSIGIVVLHSDSDYLSFPGGAGMASHGFLTLCANVENPADPLEKKLLSVKLAVDEMRRQPGIDQIVLLGHSGGATLMSLYQAIAENGSDIFQDDRLIVKLGNVPSLPVADGIMLIDSNFGNGVMTLVSIDPAVQDEASGCSNNPAFDPFSTENGYRADGTTHYSDAFLSSYYIAQAERADRIRERALERLSMLEKHQGRFADDEPFLIPGGSQVAPNNRLFPQDLHLLSHTKGAYDLIHGRDGSITHEVIRSLRTPRGALYGTTLYGLGCWNTTVRTYLSSNCVRTLPGYRVTETGIEGVDYDSCFCCTPGNVKHIHAPMLIMGMTGGYECIASEMIYENAASADKTIAFVEGGTHMLGTAHDAEQYPGQFGDAPSALFDAMAQWLTRRMK